tara:strand:- start:2860 stop:3711 length:852 start_codon:yes stop_codon:yes gene_type:complete
MPVGAIIGGAAALGGSIIGGNAQRKAANRAADTSLQVAQQNNALARDIYNQNKTALNPYVQRGNAAGEQMNALLGLGGSQQAYGAQPAQPNALLQFNGAGQRDMYPQVGPQSQFDGIYNEFRGGGNAFAPQRSYSVGGQAQYGPPQGQSAQSAANNAFDIFRNSTGYQFRLGEGMDALNSGYAGAGTLQSGAAMKDALRYAQNFASNELGNYMGYLGNQQGVGLSGASALAGVGQNYANSVGANNNSAGTAAANAQLVAGANNPFANALGAIGGGLLSGGIKI